MLLNSHNLGLLADISPLNGGLTFHDLILAAYKADFFHLEVLQMLKDVVRFSQKISLRECKQ
jgi:hypothetical protein